MRQAYAALPAVLAYLDAVRKDVVENVTAFIEDADEEGWAWHYPSQ